jgi:hypothetical protein
MKAFAHLSPTVPAVFVAATGISLWLFLLPGAGVQGGPTPLLAVIGGAGRVAADLPATANERASEPVGKAAASSAQLAITRSEHFGPRRKVATKAHRVHGSGRSGVGRRAPSAHPQAAATAASTTPVTTRQFFISPKTATSKARGHGRARTTAGAPAPRAHGNGKAFARSGEHHHGLPHGHAKKAPTAPLSAPTTPPKVNGGGNGHKGGKK